MEDQSLLSQVLEALRQLADPAVREKMASFGINNAEALGIKIPQLKQLAREQELKRNHALALQLWQQPLHEAKLLAIFCDDPKAVTEAQLDQWAGDFYSWDIVDSACSQLIVKSPFARKKLSELVDREEEFMKRAGFVLMVSLAIHDKQAKNEEFLSFLPLLEREAWDERNFVKKAVNWALRQIGKRNQVLNEAAIECAGRIKAQGSKAARWIAQDALRELQSEHVQTRLAKKANQ